MTTNQIPNTTGPRVAVLGLGTMGAAMATRLLAAGIAVDVWNRSPSPAMTLVERGATAYAEPAEAVSSADVVLTALPTEDALRSVIDRGVLDAFRPGAVWAQMGTIGATATDALAADVVARRADVTFVDAPVSGSRGPAEAGELLILAAGPRPAARILEPVFAQLGRRTIWLSSPGAATRLKLVLNTWLAFLVEGAAETVALAEQLGVPQSVLVDALDGGPLGAALAMAKIAKMDHADYRPDFSLQWALKDINLALAAGGTRTTPVADAIAERWQDLAAHGLGQLDVSAARYGLDGDDLDADANEASRQALVEALR
jgi:3-hydroxyisobutyrate dehydrogenase